MSGARYDARPTRARHLFAADRIHFAGSQVDPFDYTSSTTRHRRSQPYDPPDFSSLKAWIHATSAPPAGRTAPSESPAGLLAARGTSRPVGSWVHNCTAGTEAPGVSVVGRCAAAGSKSVPGFPYNAVRIDAYPHLVSADPYRNWELLQMWNQMSWGHSLRSACRYCQRCWSSLGSAVTAASRYPFRRGTERIATTCG